PALNILLSIFTAIPQPPFECFAVRGKHENADRVRQIFLNLGRALHIDIQQQVLATLSGLTQESSRCPITVSVHVRVFQKFSVAHHLLKLFHGYKVILFSILLTAAGRPCRVGNGKNQVGNQLENFVGQRGFSRTGWRRNDVDQWLSIFVHSRFCTCSRDFSISDFIARPASVIFNASPARPEVFESSVLASRFISCKRKSSFLPISPPSSSNPRKCFTCVSSRTISS